MLDSGIRAIETRAALHEDDFGVAPGFVWGRLAPPWLCCS